MRKILLIVALVGVASLHLSEAIPYVYDELLYTKQFWEEYKLDFPYSIFKNDDEVVARAKDSLAGLFLEDSLSGPQSNLAELIENDLKRGEFQPNSFEISLIDDNTPLAGAASVAQCKTCLALATVMWQGLVQWSHRYMGTVAAHDLIPYGEALCEYEVPEILLKEWVILSARVHGNGNPDHAPQQFYMLSVRHRQHARVREIQVVRAACKALLSDNHFDALQQGRELSSDDILRMEASPLLDMLAQRQQEYLVALKKKGALPLETPKEDSNGAGENIINNHDTLLGVDDTYDLENKAPPLEDEDIPPSAPLPEVQRDCFNKHPQCEYWAERGECTANPGYMVGTETTGWCRAACFVCPPPHPQPTQLGGALTVSDISDLEGISTTLLDTIQTAGCLKSSSCNGIEDMSAAKSRLASAAGVDPDRAVALQKVELISGPIEAESFGNTHIDGGSDTRGGGIVNHHQGVSGGDAQLLDDTAVVTTLPIEKAVLPKSKETLKEKSPPAKDASAVEKAVYNELHDQCMYITHGWWSYELCYLHTLTQFHMPGGQSTPEWLISLGQYHSSDWEVRNMTVRHHRVGLYPVGSVVPYVSQQLESGNICELTGESGVNFLEKVDDDDDDDGGGGEHHEIMAAASSTDADNGGRDSTESKNNKALKIGDQVLRTTVLRFMCSPDLSKHIAVVEPEQCRYIVDVYVPALCKIKGMAPMLPETVDPTTDSGHGVEYSQHTMDVDFDDPYVDPDELEEIEILKKAKKKKKKKKKEPLRKDEL
jgi:hypothetical protein